jgi:hypothetical protein
MCVNETNNRVRVGRHLSDTFPVKNGLKQGEDLSPLLSSSTLVDVIRRTKREWLKLNDTLEFPVYEYAVDINISGGGINTIRKIKEALLVASKELCLDISAEKTKHCIRSCLATSMQDKSRHKERQ